jgi:hypothetical protein
MWLPAWRPAANAALGVRFETVTRIDLLHAGWRKVRSNGGGPGGDAVTIEQFGRDLDRRLDGLRRALSTGRYRPGPLRVFQVPKKSGGTRELAVPCVVDRVAQTALLLAVVPALDARMAHESFAYRPGRSTAQALSLAARIDRAWAALDRRRRHRALLRIRPASRLADRPRHLARRPAASESRRSLAARLLGGRPRASARRSALAAPRPFHKGDGHEHAHAFWLAEDFDEDGRIDHVLLFAASGLPRSLIPVLRRAGGSSFRTSAVGSWRQTGWGIGRLARCSVLRAFGSR